MGYETLKELPTAGKRGRELYLTLVMNQKSWIEWCEANDAYHTRPRGSGADGNAIREADYAELARLENLLRKRSR